MSSITMSASSAQTFADVLACHHLTLEVFFREYWQKKPLHLKGLASGWKNKIDPETLAGLSLEPSIDSRMVIKTAENQWSVKHGPLSEEDFAARDNSTHPWTILVHGVDRAIPDIRATLDFWSGFPHWRMDDVMISYASEGGGVGPHFDEYDVFLIQIKGERHWTLGEFCDANTPLLKHEDLKLLADMGDETQSWLIQPGDALYVPARMAHNGVARNECLTWSMGFRSPSWGEAFSDFISDFLEEDFASARYQDTIDTLLDPYALANPGVITNKTISQFQTILCNWIQTSGKFEPWLVSFLSGYGQRGTQLLPVEENLSDIVNNLRQSFESEKVLVRDEDTSILYAESSDFCLYANSERITYPAHVDWLAKLIANYRSIPLSQLDQLFSNEEGMMWLADLLNKGYVYLE